MLLWSQRTVESPYLVLAMELQVFLGFWPVLVGLFGQNLNALSDVGQNLPCPQHAVCIEAVIARKTSAFTGQMKETTASIPIGGYAWQAALIRLEHEWHFDNVLDRYGILLSPSAKHHPRIRLRTDL